MNYPKALTISQLKEILEEAEKQIGGDSLVYFWDGNKNLLLVAIKINKALLIISAAILMLKRWVLKFSILLQ